MDVVDRADIEALLLVDLLGLGGEEDDGNVARGGNVLESAADFIAMLPEPLEWYRVAGFVAFWVWFFWAKRKQRRALSLSTRAAAITETPASAGRRCASTASRELSSSRR